MMIGVTGCGSDDDVEVESRVKNAAPEASGVSDGPSEADCDLIYDTLGRRDLLVDLRDIRDLLSRCDAASDSGADAPEGDDVDGG